MRSEHITTIILIIIDIILRIEASSMMEDWYVVFFKGLSPAENNSIMYCIK